jgi:hypothetical protein
VFPFVSLTQAQMMSSGHAVAAGFFAQLPVVAARTTISEKPSKPTILSFTFIILSFRASEMGILSICTFIVFNSSHAIRTRRKMSRGRTPLPHPLACTIAANVHPVLSSCARDTRADATLTSNTWHRHGEA